MTRRTPSADREMKTATQQLSKQVHSREWCEELRAIGIEHNEPMVEHAADLLLLARQAMRGGRLNVRGSRHWGDV